MTVLRGNNGKSQRCIRSGSYHTGSFSQMHFLHLLFVSWEVVAGEYGKWSCPCARGKSQTFSSLFILQPGGGMCNTEILATAPLPYYFTGVISVCLAMCMKLYETEKGKIAPCYLVRGHKGALLYTKGGELSFLRWTSFRWGSDKRVVSSFFKGSPVNHMSYLSTVLMT